MRPAAKAGIVVAGYVAAVGVASLVLRVYIAATDGPDRQTYVGMYAFGDSLLFLGVASVAAIPATGAALFFLRPYRGFWKVLSRIFTFNHASLALCEACGFRQVGVYEKHACLEGRWLDCAIVERLFPVNQPV